MTKSFDDYFKENFEDGLSSPSRYILRHTYEAGQQSKQAEVDELQKRIDCYEKLTLSLRNEFDLWSDYTESFDAIEAQIEILESLKGENHEY